MARSRRGAVMAQGLSRTITAGRARIMVEWPGGCGSPLWQERPNTLCYETDAEKGKADPLHPRAVGIGGINSCI